MQSEPLILKNPHTILAVMQQRPKDVLELNLSGGATSIGWQQVIDQSNGFKVQTTRQSGPQHYDQRKRQKNEPKTERNSANFALVKERPYKSMDKVLQKPEEGYGLYLALDCLQDPHNVGAILRSASFFGVNGVIITRDRSAPLNATVYDISAGGIEFLNISVETNLARTIDYAKEQGMWILGTSEHAEKSLVEIKKDRNWLIIIGNEQEGMRRLTKEKCDDICSIPALGGVTSLNASVATGVMLSHFQMYSYNM